MAGNTIYMQEGSNYIDIHDNEVVNLSVDKGTVRVADAAQCKATGKGMDESGIDDGADVRKAKDKAAVLTENKAFMRILQKAVEHGFCQQDGWQYKWKTKVEAAYFASLASEKFQLSKRKNGNRLAVSWIPFEALFGLTDLRLAFNDYKQCKTRVPNEEDIDKLFG